MVKVQIKSEKITPFEGLFSIMGQFVLGWEAAHNTHIYIYIRSAQIYNFTLSVKTIYIYGRRLARKTYFYIFLFTENIFYLAFKHIRSRHLFCASLTKKNIYVVARDGMGAFGLVFVLFFYIYIIFTLSAKHTFYITFLAAFEHTLVCLLHSMCYSHIEPHTHSCCSLLGTCSALASLWLGGA